MIGFFKIYAIIKLAIKKAGSLELGIGE